MERKEDTFFKNMKLVIKSKLKRKYRSNRPKCAAKKGVLNIFAKFTGNRLRSATLLKKRLCHRCFPMKFAKFLRTPCWKTSQNDYLCKKE